MRTDDRGAIGYHKRHRLTGIGHMLCSNMLSEQFPEHMGSGSPGNPGSMDSSESLIHNSGSVCGSMDSSSSFYSCSLYTYSFLKDIISGPPGLSEKTEI